MNKPLRKEKGTELFERFMQGDKGAMEELHALYYNPLLIFGLALTNERELVKDVIQDLFLWLLRQKGKDPSIRDMDLYLFKALRQNLRGQLAHREDRRLRKELFVRQPSPQFSGSPEDKVIAEEEQKGTLRSLFAEINRLPQRQREILLLRFYHELSYKQIASLLTISNQGARNTVSRALKTLRRQAGHLRDRVSLLLPFLVFFFQL